MKKKVLLTGGKGFIGKNLLDFFNQDKKFGIIAPSRNELDLSNYQSSENFLNNCTVDYVIHGASVGVKRSQIYNNGTCLMENLKIFSNIFFKNQQSELFIQLGSGAEYARPLKHFPVPEDLHGRYIPEDEYGFSKFCCTKMMDSHLSSNGVVLHIFAVFGEFEDYKVRFISQSIIRVILGLPIVVNQDTTFDYLDINDFNNIVHFFLKNKPTEKRYNVGSGKPYKLSEIAEMIRNHSPNKVDIIIKNKDQKGGYAPDISRLKDFMKDSFKITPIEDSIKRLIFWYEKEIKFIDKDVLNSFI